AGGRRADTRLPRLEPLQPPRLPHSLRGLAPTERLPAEVAMRVQDRRGQRHVVVERRDVLRWHADLDDLQVLGGLEHPMAYLRRLDDAVSGAELERRALVLVHQPDRTAVAEDQLKADRVV